MLAYYQSDLKKFITSNDAEIIGEITKAHSQSLKHLQVITWQTQIDYLRDHLPSDWEGHLFFEFVIPRMGKRADCILIIRGIVFVIEFKVGSDTFD